MEPNVPVQLFFLSLRVYIYIFGINIRRSLKNMYRGYGIGGRVLGLNSEGLLCTKKSNMLFDIRFFPVWPIVTKFCTKFYYNFGHSNVVFSVRFCCSYFISFAYWLSSWLPNPSNWNFCCFSLHNLVSVNEISSQNELYQLVLRPKYSFTKITTLYHFFEKWTLN